MEERTKREYTAVTEWKIRSKRMLVPVASLVKGDCF